MVEKDPIDERFEEIRIEDVDGFGREKIERHGYAEPMPDDHESGEYDDEELDDDEETYDNESYKIHLLEKIQHGIGYLVFCAVIFMLWTLLSGMVGGMAASIVAVVLFLIWLISSVIILIVKLAR